MRGGMRYTALAVVDLSLYGGTYYKAWSGSAKTSRNKWLHQSDTKIIETDIDTYMSYYDRSIVPNKMREIFKKQIYDYSKIYGNNVHFFLAQDKNTNQPLSGFCCVDDFEANQSLHLVAFRSEKNIPRYVGIGLINYWMEHLQRVGIRYANLGVVWQKGDPKSWIGYSDFKMHFSPKIYRYENPLFKIRWNK
jgi:hypothetical protein